MLRGYYASIYEVNKPSWKFTVDITLEESPVPVTRRVIVPSNIRLSHLSELLIRAIGWEGYHLCEFLKGDDCYTDSESCAEARSWENRMHKYHDYSRYTLGQVLRQDGDEAEFIYDFGDDWKHKIVLAKKEKYPKSGYYEADLFVVSGQNACPPENVGGVWGYKEALETLANPGLDTDEYNQLMEWLPEGFNPEVFDIRASRLRVNDYLRLIRTLFRY